MIGQRLTSESLRTNPKVHHRLSTVRPKAISVGQSPLLPHFMKNRPNQIRFYRDFAITENQEKKCDVHSCPFNRHAFSIYCPHHFKHFIRHHSPSRKKPSKQALLLYREACKDLLQEFSQGTLEGNTIRRNLCLIEGWLQRLLDGGRHSHSPKTIRRYEYVRKLTHYLGVMKEAGVTPVDLLTNLGAVYAYDEVDPYSFDARHRGRQFRRVVGETLLKTGPRQFQIRINSPRNSITHQIQVSEAVGVFESLGNIVMRALGVGLMGLGKEIVKRLEVSITVGRRRDSQPLRAAKNCPGTLPDQCLAAVPAHHGWTAVRQDMAIEIKQADRTECLGSGQLP